MAKYGYACSNTRINNLKGQILLLSRSDVDEKNIVFDAGICKEHGQDNLKNLLGLDGSKPILKKGDVLLLSGLERLGNNWTERSERWDKLVELGVYIQVLDMPIIDTCPSNVEGEIIQKVVSQLLRYVGAKSAKRGRPSITYPQNWPEIRKSYLIGSCTAKVACDKLGISSKTFSRWLKEYKVPSEP